MKNSQQKSSKQAVQITKRKVASGFSKKPAFIAVMALALLAISTVVVNSDARNFIFGSFARTRYVCVKADHKIPRCTGGGIPVWNQSKCKYSCKKEKNGGSGNTSNTSVGCNYGYYTCNRTYQWCQDNSSNWVKVQTRKTEQGNYYNCTAPKIEYVCMYNWTDPYTDGTEWSCVDRRTGKKPTR